MSHIASASSRPVASVSLSRLILRWALIGLLALDLLGSPIHGHRHDGGLVGVLAHADLISTHGDDQDHEAGGATLAVGLGPADPGGHSLALLRSTYPPISSATERSGSIVVLPPMLVLSGLVLQAAVDAAPPWRPGWDQVRIPHFRTVIPDGRAPPSFHA